MANIQRRCGFCKKYFPSDEMIIRGLSAFCSDEHLFEKMNAKPSKANKPRAAKKLQILDEVSDEVREQVLKADSYRCRYCGEGGGNLITHHVVYRSEARGAVWLHQISNLITLHNEPCHLSIIHKNKKLYKPLCLQVIWLREVSGDRTTTIKQLESRMKDVEF